MTQQNRDAAKRDQDDVRQADEAGEPRRSGWSHGHPVADDDPRQKPARDGEETATDPDRPADKKGGAVGEDLESGRQGSV